MGYAFSEIEKKWQQYWEYNGTFVVSDTTTKPKYYVLDMFPYPSAEGLHVGHLEGYTASDIVARYKRMRGFHVLHPIGWDSFGLPTETYAIKVKRHPATITQENIGRFKKQITAMGFSYDWTREITTSSPPYYRWTQWLFLKLYERGLAYQAQTMVNYCPTLKTVLANEEVIDGKSERGGYPVIRIPKKQWILRITEYAERLLADLDNLDWPEHVKEMQRNWIGKSHGSDVLFHITERGEPLSVFTTRPDTLMGVTYLALAPEHPWVADLVAKDPHGSIAQIVTTMLSQTERDRESGVKQKYGARLPLTAIHPISGVSIPVWVASYVMMGYGTGAIMAVPAHDERDGEFAQMHKLPAQTVIDENGTLIHSGMFDGMLADKAKSQITQYLAAQHKGKASVRYRLRDWIFSRQRYWGEPIPILHFSDGTQRPLDPSELPLELPEADSYEPAGDGQSPLSTIPEWVDLIDPKSEKPAKRETDTMPQWAGSCWYYLRYIDPQNTSAPWDIQKEKFWLPVDLYIGGVEHATLHLLYARFWHKVFYDCGLVSTPEPFQKLVNQGMILGEDNEKMSKSRGNVVNPDTIISEYGADTVRLYEMFLGPLEIVKPWNTRGIVGLHRFLHRLFAIIENIPHVLLHGHRPTSEETTRLHRCIHKVQTDVEQYKFNTAISEMMTFLNFIYEQKSIHRDTLGIFVKLLCPFAPHICEEIWQHLGHTTCLSIEPWPVYDPHFLTESEIIMAVQVNGRLKGTITVTPNTHEEKILGLIAKDEKLGAWLSHPSRIRTIVIPNKIVNIVIKADGA